MILTTVIHQAQLELCIKESKKLVENPSFEYRLALAQCLLKSAQPPEGIEGNSHAEFAHHDAVQMIICTSHHTTWMVKAVKCHLFDFCKEQLHGQAIEAISFLSNRSLHQASFEPVVSN